MLSAKQGHYWYHFYNVFGMTRSLKPGPPALDASTIPLGYRGGGMPSSDFVHTGHVMNVTLALKGSITNNSYTTVFTKVNIK